MHDEIGLPTEWPEIEICYVAQEFWIVGFPHPQSPSPAETKSHHMGLQDILDVVHSPFTDVLAFT